jgi:hypothetical protein
MADVGPATGMCPASTVCMPMMKVCASAAATSSVVAARPTPAFRQAKCHA